MTKENNVLLFFKVVGNNRVEYSSILRLKFNSLTTGSFTVTENDRHLFHYIVQFYCDMNTDETGSASV